MGRAETEKGTQAASTTEDLTETGKPERKDRTETGPMGRIGWRLVVVVAGGKNRALQSRIRESSSSIDSLTNEVGGQRPGILEGWMLDASVHRGQIW